MEPAEENENYKTKFCIKRSWWKLASQEEEACLFLKSSYNENFGMFFSWTNLESNEDGVKLFMSKAQHSTFLLRCDKSLAWIVGIVGLSPCKDTGFRCTDLFYVQIVKNLILMIPVMEKGSIDWILVQVRILDRIQFRITMTRVFNRIYRLSHQQSIFCFNHLTITWLFSFPLTFRKVTENLLRCTSIRSQNRI